jgi:glyoxylase-like metal-dependent hydrolase (beta-lactamase superfamily II)
MKRVVLLAVLLAAGSASVALKAYQQAPVQPSAKALDAEKLKDNLWVLKGANSGGNTAVFVTATGVVIVDTKNPGWGQPIIEKVRELTVKPITTIINTHTHGDHVSGNVEFTAPVEIIVHENTRANMAKMLSPSGFAPSKETQTIFEKNSGRGLPTRAFSDSLIVGSGGDRVELRYFGRGHTNGDAWVIFPAQRVMHAGDIFSGKNVPLLDAINGGSGVEIAATLMKAADYADGKVDAIITGHSTQMTVSDLREYSTFNADFVTAVRDAKTAGTTAEALAASWKMPEKYKGYAAPQPARLKSNIDVILAELK